MQGELYKYLESNREGLIPYQERGIETAGSTEGDCV